MKAILLGVFVVLGWASGRSGGGYCVNYIEELRVAIRYLHGGEATHVESVPVKETFQGKTVWEGIVEVFDLHGHREANRVYAWAHATDDKKHPSRHVTVLHIPPVISPETAVKAVIVQQYPEIN